MLPDVWQYALFVLLVIFLLALDLGVFNRTPHVVKLSEALGWSTVWVTLALLFNGYVYWSRGAVAAKEFFAGYLLEQSLSVDNIFVIILILHTFKVAPQYFHKVLFWGILGALVMRGTMIGLGTALIHQFDWIFYVFGAFLVYTGIRMAQGSSDEGDIMDSPVVKFFRRHMRLTNEFHQERFFVVQNGVRFATLLFLVVLVVEVTDLVFAVDSIPAIFAVTHDPFIVFTSNVFAVMGLRSLFFAVAGVMNLFHHLKYGLSIILSFIGVKMLIHDWVDIPIDWALGGIASVITLSIVASLIWPEKAADEGRTSEGA
jgi:tellurite resistance protein TerC